MAANVRITTRPTVPFGANRDDWETDYYVVIGHGVNSPSFRDMHDAIEYIESYVEEGYAHEVNRYRHGWRKTFPLRCDFEDGWKIAAIARPKEV